MMNQRSSTLLDETCNLDLSDSTLTYLDRFVLTMDALVEWQRVEALGWWEHTSDWDLEISVLTNDGREHHFEGSPGFHMTIDGKEYMPWELLEHATEMPINFADPNLEEPYIAVHITNAWVYDDRESGDGREVSEEFSLTSINAMIHNR